MVAIKDVIDLAGSVTTCGSPLDAPRSARDAQVVERLRDAGCSVVGKTNLQPWAFGVTSANPYWGDVQNPADPSRIPGGSSGGSAVAVAAEMCDWAIGTDTGGSVRIPAALCGVVGFKPTNGAIDLSGIVPLAPSLDCVGILARDVDSTERAFDVVRSQNDDTEREPGLTGRPRLAIPAGWLADLDTPVTEMWQRISDGIEVVAFPERRSLARTGMTILLVEAASVHAQRLEEQPWLFPPTVRDAIERGASIPHAEYEAALDARASAMIAADDAMAGIDALLLPTVGRTAPRRTEPIRDADLTRYTLPFNVTAQPAVSLPVGSGGLPIGMELVGRRGLDRSLISTARAVEHAWALV